MAEKYPGVMIPVPLGLHMISVEDREIIEEVSRFEARREYYRWTVNEATVAYYDALVHEWKRRYGQKHLPRRSFTKADLQEFYEEYMGAFDDEIKI